MLCISAQSGKTESLLDIIGQRFDQSPCPTLFTGPTRQAVLEQTEPRIVAMLDQAPSLSGKVSAGKRSTKSRKLIAGVPLRLAHAGSSASLKSDSFGLCITDEADELVANVKGQGDPLGLIDARGETWPSFVHAITSTPGRGVTELEHDEVSDLDFWKVQKPDDVASTIWKLWQAGTRYHWTWPCPHCGAWFVPRFSCLDYVGKDDGTATPAQARSTAVILCPNNGCVIRNHDREAMNRRGLFVAPGQRVEGDMVVGEPPESETISFWVSGLCTPFRSIGDRAAAYAEAYESGDTSRIQSVVNQGFGELYQATAGDAPAWQAVKECEGDYRVGDVPEGVRLVCAGVDVQKRKLVVVVRGFGARQESWLLDYQEIFGDTRGDDVWSELDDILATKWAEKFVIRRCLIDSGYRPDDKDSGDTHRIYEYARLRVRQVRAAKGWDKRRQPISVARIEVTPSGKRPKFGLDLVHLDSDEMKSWVHARILWPKEQAGGFHLPVGISEQYCRELVAEARTRKPSGGYVWVSLGGRHDFLDAEALCYAAARLGGLDRIAGRRRVEDKPAESTATPTVAPAPAPAPAPADNWFNVDAGESWFRR